jgi:polyisoprenoid-binding protein YceI
MLPMLALLLLAVPLPARSKLSVDTKASSIRFRVDHALHGVEGESKEIDGKAMARDDGKVVALVRAQLASFHSGDSNRDAHMLEVLEAERFPVVVFRGVAATVPENAEPVAPVEMSGEIELHGRKSAVKVPVKVEPQPDGTLRARAAFDVSLDAHQVERPSLLFIKISDTCRIEVDLVLRRQPGSEQAQGPAAGGSQ